MSTTLLMILVAGACLAGWALLTLLGGERQRLLSEMEGVKPRHPQRLPPAATKPPAAKAVPKSRPSTEPAAPKKRGASTPAPAPAPANAR